MSAPVWIQQEREKNRLRMRTALARKKEVTHAPRTCPHCNAVFTPSVRSDQKYCGLACQSRHARYTPEYRAIKNKRRRQANRDAKRSWAEKRCIGCGVSFTPRTRRDQIYCVRECRYGTTVVRVSGVRLNRRTDPPPLIAVAEAIKETRALLRNLEETTRDRQG